MARRSYGVRPFVGTRAFSETGAGAQFSPLSLFSAGEQGAWYDPASLTTLFQASGGTSPVTTVGNPVGLARDSSGRTNDALQATAGSRPLWQKRINRFTFSEDMTNAVWTKTAASISGSKIVEDTTASSVHTVRQDAVTENGQITASYEVAKGERTIINVAFSDLVAGGVSVTFDLTKGDIFGTPSATGSWTGMSYGIRAVTGGRWQIWVTASKGAGTTARVTISLHNGTSTTYTGDGVSGAYLYKAQINRGQLATYQQITTTALFDTAGFVPFLDYDTVDDSLVTTFVAALGTGNCTVIRAVPGTGASILTGQTIGTSYTDSTDHAGLILLGRALTAAETAGATAWANARANLVDRTINSIAAWGDSLTAGTGGGGTNYPMDLAAGTTPRGYYNGGVGGETSTQIKVRMLADTLHLPWVALLWLGRNNFTDPTTVKADIAACVANLTHTRYLVYSVLPSTADSAPDLATLMALNSDLSTLYGSRYVDVLGYLRAHGDGSANDLADIAAGLVPRSLRSDAVHLNAAGYQLVADCVAAKLTSLGW